MSSIIPELIDPKGLQYVNSQFNNPLITNLADIMSQLKNKKKKAVVY